MIKILRQFSFILAFTFTCLLQATGPETGGGGNYISTYDSSSNEIARILDFYVLPQELREKMDLAFLSLPASRIEEPKKLKSDKDTFPDDQAFRYLQALFNKWTSVSNMDPTMAWLSVTASIKIKWEFSDEPLTSQNFYIPENVPSSFDKDTVKTAAYYFHRENKNKGKVKIFRPAWNLMPLQDQIGLLLHETLRNFQFGQGFEFNDELLQKTTTLLMSCSPTLVMSRFLSHSILKFKDFEHNGKEYILVELLDDFQESCEKDFKININLELSTDQKDYMNALKDLFIAALKK